MIVVTGGAGFIGSALIWRLNQQGEDDILAVDHLGESDKWANLAGVRFTDYFEKNEFIEKLEAGAFGNSITAILHLGACSSTTEKNASYLMENNYRYTMRLAQWWENHRACRFIYASSAATYGDGAMGYNDSHEMLARLRPLNMYGYSKHLFDLTAMRKGWLASIAGLKYFNVFGPNEGHKQEMRSVINKAYPRLAATGTISLFKSHRDDYKDGEQRRDFIYVKDAVEMTLFFLQRTDVNGIYNIGTGLARTWNDVANAMFDAVGKPRSIEYVDMPAQLHDKYQYYTCADISRLRKAGCAHQCMGLENAVTDYVRNYLVPGKRLSVHAE